MSENAGVAYLLECQAGVWSVVEKLVPSASWQPFGRFGSSVDIQSSALGTFAIVGAPRGILGADGGVYVYERTGGVWSEVVKLTAPSPAVGRTFGSAVALSGGFLAVGAPNETSVATDAGVVYMFILVAGVWQFDAVRITRGDCR